MLRLDRCFVVVFGLAAAACGSERSSPSAPAPTPEPTPTTGVVPVFDGGVGEAGARAWTPRASLPRPMQEVAVVALGGLLYVLGGFDDAGRTLKDVVVYDPRADAWRAGVPLPRPLHHLNAAVVGERLWITGALEGSAFTAVGPTLVFDPASATWTERAPMPIGTERGSSMAAAIGKSIYVAGGLRGSAVADVSVYDTELDTWTAAAPLPAARDHGGGIAADGVFFAVSGRSTIRGHTPRVDVFAAGSWSARAPMPTSRAGSALALDGDRIIVAGGEGNASAASGVFAEVEAYSIATNAWAALPPMLTPRHGTGGAVIDGVLYVPGGGIRQGFGATAIVEALPLR